MKKRIIYIQSENYKMKLIILEPKKRNGLIPGILWIHGGGYMLGSASTVYRSGGKSIAKRFDSTVISPEYRLAKKAPYPAALNDCYAALEYMWDNADILGIDKNKILVGGVSAGGGLAAAICIYARDKGKIKIAMQMPLYPMIDCNDTESSKDNHGKIWNTKRNHWGWKHYLGDLYGTGNIPPYASASRETNYSNLPPCYTYVCEGEPFYSETIKYIKNLQNAGVNAKIDIYPGNVHAFDMFCFWKKSAKEAKRNRLIAFDEIINGTNQK